MKNHAIREIVASELTQAFAVLCELREHLDFQTFSARLQRQSEHGYRLYGAFAGATLARLIGTGCLQPLDFVFQRKSEIAGFRFICFNSLFANGFCCLLQMP